jgi:hypothetical protein
LLRAKVFDNRGMRSPQRLNFLARLVLAWFLASVVVASASPLVHPSRFDMVCSGGGVMKWVVIDNTGDDEAHAELSMLTCPACLPFLAPANSPTVSLPPLETSPLRLEVTFDAPDVHSSPRAPLPPRGPPRGA